MQESLNTNHLYILRMIRQLRESEEVMLYANILRSQEGEAQLIINFLRGEYLEECLNYPHTPPEFDEAAALWSAKIVYSAAQYLLYREHNITDLDAVFVDYEGEVTPSAILSADLCLRFLPDLLLQLKLIDADDLLGTLLDNIAIRWHYSTMRSDQEIDQLNFETVLSDPCTRQLYVNRIIENKKLKLATQPELIQAVKGSLGLYREQLWNELSLETAYEQQ